MTSANLATSGGIVDAVEGNISGDLDRKNVIEIKLFQDSPTVRRFSSRYTYKLLDGRFKLSNSNSFFDSFGFAAVDVASESNLGTVSTPLV